MDQSLDFLLFQAAVQTGIIVDFPEDVAVSGRTAAAEKSGTAAVLHQMELQMGQERTVIKTVDRPGQGNADHSAGMTAGIRIKDKDSDLIPHFKHTVLFQGIDGGANRRTSEFESTAQLILGGKFFSAFYFFIAYITHQQLFGSLCLAFSHKKPVMKTKNSLQKYIISPEFCFVKQN